MPRRPSVPPSTRISQRRRSRQSFDTDNTDDSIQSKLLNGESSSTNILQNASQLLSPYISQKLHQAHRVEVERLGELLAILESDLSTLKTKVQALAEITTPLDYVNNLLEVNELYEE